MAAFGGIGFTVSLFIAQLGYDNPAVVNTAKVGIFIGSLVSGLLGAVLLSRRTRHRAALVAARSASWQQRGYACAIAPAGRRARAVAGQLSGCSTTPGIW
jgi:hypothetical protein